MWPPFSFSDARELGRAEIMSGSGSPILWDRSLVRFLGVATCVVGLCACGFPRPADVGGDGGGQSDSMSDHTCAPSQALRCDGNSLVRCNDGGTGERSEPCALGCNDTEVRCNDVAPSNGLDQFLEMTPGEVDFDLGTTASINTDDGTVQVDGKPIVVRSTAVAQISAPTLRVFIVHSLSAADVTITGSNALAIVSNGDLKFNGTFAASAHAAIPGAGGFNDSTCRGRDGTGAEAGAISGSGGGGFGSSGATGGSAINTHGMARGGAGGLPTGNLKLVPLRGGCDAGMTFGSGSFFGAGGGAVQLVSRTKIVVPGVIAANGSSYSGGGSGGGILLEAPVVEVPGNVVANGGAGAGGCLLPQAGEDGRPDATPATGGLPCDTNAGNGGNGAARNAGAGGGIDAQGVGLAFGGHGGGGVGRIRVNTVSGGLHAIGVFSPNPSTGTIAIR